MAVLASVGGCNVWQQQQFYDLQHSDDKKHKNTVTLNLEEAGPGETADIALL